MKNVKNDLTGLVFGRLKVLKQIDDYIEPNGTHRDRWLCECSCEKHTLTKVLGKNLTKKNGTHSCGCISREVRRKQNRYIEYDSYVIGISANTNEEFYFDKSNYDLVKQYCWYVHNYPDGYRRLETKNPKTKKIISMAQLFGCDQYDHADRNTLNNRMENLRPATVQENARNHSKSKRNNSGIIGVGWNKTMEQWRSRITVNKIVYELGFFYDKTDAIKARLNAEDKYFGEFAPQKHLFEQYGIKQNNVEDTTE